MQFESVEHIAPKAEEESTSVGAHLVVWHNICKLPAYIAYVLQHRVALLALAHQYCIRIDLCSKQMVLSMSWLHQRR